MNYLPRHLHEDICWRLKRGNSIREVMKATGAAKGTVQTRKSMLVSEGWNWADMPGGKVRSHSSVIMLSRVEAIRRQYPKKRGRQSFDQRPRP